MTDAYEEALRVNEEVVERALSFQDTEDKVVLNTLLFEIHMLLEPTSKQVAYRICEKACLPADLVSDMVQDAYLRLFDAINSWDYTKNPTFLSYWRSVFHNHLITKYQSQWRHPTLDERVPDTKERDSTDNFLVEEILSFYIRLFSTYEPWPRRLCTWILLKRILIPPDEAISQKDLAAKLGRCQSYLSQWEKWIRAKIKEDFPNGLAR